MFASKLLKASQSLSKVPKSFPKPFKAFHTSQRLLKPSKPYKVSQSLPKPFKASPNLPKNPKAFPCLPKPSKASIGPKPYKHLQRLPKPPKTFQSISNPLKAFPCLPKPSRASQSSSKLPRGIQNFPTPPRASVRDILC